MANKKTVEKTEEMTEEAVERTGFIVWVNEHKTQLLLTGVSVTTILLAAVGLKNKSAITELWNSLRKQIEKGNLFSSKWFEKATLEEFEEARKLVQQDYNNPKLDLDYRDHCWNLLHRIDNAIGKIRWTGKEYGYPVHSSNGWHLPSDD